MIITFSHIHTCVIQVPIEKWLLAIYRVLIVWCQRLDYVAYARYFMIPSNNAMRRVPSRQLYPRRN